MRFVIIKSIQEPSPLKQVLHFTKVVKSESLENLTWLGCLVSNWILRKLPYYHTALNKNAVNQLKYSGSIDSFVMLVCICQKQPLILPQAFFKRYRLNKRIWWYLGFWIRRFSNLQKSCKVLEELFSAPINTPSPHSKYQPTFNITYETIFASHMSFASIETRTINIEIIDESYSNRGTIGFQCFGWCHQCCPCNCNC